MERNTLIERLILLQEQESQVRKQLNALDYEDKIKHEKQYEGKYFKEVYQNDSEYVRCLFVHSTDINSCEPKSISVYYYRDHNDHFQIEFYSLFDPKKYGEEEKWIEIKKEEFDKHYWEVMKRINLAISDKSPT